MCGVCRVVGKDEKEGKGIEIVDGVVVVVGVVEAVLLDSPTSALVCGETISRINRGETAGGGG